MFRFAGIDVFLHWSWFVVAVYEINSRAGNYSSKAWNVLEYLALFLIVLLHEYGHMLACRQVGGTANQIVLWPLGGVAYVDPPPRPGATLWSIAAGPLVNVTLAPVLFLLLIISRALGWQQTVPNLHVFVRSVFVIDLVLLVFNMLPVYPLDGGQILRSLLWFVIGRARSLMVATVIGLAGVAGLVVLAVRVGSMWFGILSFFMLINCWAGLKQSIALLRLSKLPRREGFACRWCKAAPLVGNFWTCGKCKQMLDIFELQAVCPHCAAHFAAIPCLDCGRSHGMADWTATALVSSTPYHVSPREA